MVYKENMEQKNNIKTAMVLAAGLGTRMRHLREQRPKPLVALGGRALLDHVLDRLVAGQCSLQGGHD